VEHPSNVFLSIIPHKIRPGDHREPQFLDLSFPADQWLKLLLLENATPFYVNVGHKLRLNNRKPQVIGHCDASLRDCLYELASLDIIVMNMTMSSTRGAR
jgi:hypothetical protein